MRGQCVVREVDRPSLIIDVSPWKDRKHHRGVVLALGEPAFLVDVAGAPRVPWDCMVGDEVLYVYVHNHTGFTRPWLDGQLATWIPQACVLGVWTAD